MNQTQRYIDSIRDAPHDTIIVAGMFAIPVLVKGGAKLGHWGGVKVDRLRERTRF